jgi:predicted enzyme related to lactoylglutathione lyase
MPNPVVHWEMMSKDPAKVSAFYENVFGWTIKPVPELDYNLVEPGGQGGIGGIFKPKRRALAGNMTLYISVDDRRFPQEDHAAAAKSTSRSRRCPNGLLRSSPTPRAA